MSGLTSTLSMTASKILSRGPARADEHLDDHPLLVSPDLFPSRIVAVLRRLRS